jgi:hypothetical protein
MGDADEFGLLAERYEGLPVLKPDRARGLEARYAHANELIEEDASIRVPSALWHESKATLGLRHHLCGIIIPQTTAATIHAGNSPVLLGKSLHSQLGAQQEHAR